MKKTILATMALTLAANSAMALDANSIRTLRAGSEAEAMAAVENERAEILKLTQEVGNLQGQISVVKQNIASGKTVRNVSLVITAGLAVATGLLARKTRTDDLSQLGVTIFFGITTTGGAAVAGGIAGYKQYAIVVESGKLELLEKELADVNVRLEERLAALK